MAEQSSGKIYRKAHIPAPVGGAGEEREERLLNFCELRALCGSKMNHAKEGDYHFLHHGIIIVTGENLMTETSLQDMIRALPPELQDEVRDFVKFLSAQQAKKRKAKMNFTWQGALKDLRSQYTSVELQHRISDMRAGLDETAS